MGLKNCYYSPDSEVGKKLFYSINIIHYTNTYMNSFSRIGVGPFELSNFILEFNFLHEKDKYFELN